MCKDKALAEDFVQDFTVIAVIFLVLGIICTLILCGIAKKEREWYKPFPLKIS